LVTGFGKKVHSFYYHHHQILSASLRRADAAQVCSDGGFVHVDGDFECSVAIAARQIVSKRL
jgi:hypothetical protein